MVPIGTQVKIGVREITHVIGEPCIGVKDASCAAVCPVACISERQESFWIDPDICVDCGACVPVCPVSAITPASTQPDEYRLAAPDP